jgi:L-ascorbate metabolism protein UlaG (beta-lactamase superfamily)
MQIEYFGGNCVRLSTKKVTVVVDDNLADLGQKSITKPENISVITNSQLYKSIPSGQFVIDRPGEYEVMDVSAQAIAARAHIDNEGEQKGLAIRLVIEDIKIGVLGHIYPELSEEQLEALGMIDVLIVPVGGNGYTLDGVGALKLIKKISPKIVIPTHSGDSKLKYEVPPAPLEEAIKGLAMEPSETLDSLKIKGRDFEEGTKLIVLNRQ